MSRVMLMSDLHIDTNANILDINRTVLKKSFFSFIKEKESEFDVLLIVGDISDNMMYSLTLLGDLKDILAPEKVIKFVPGNHDVSIINSFNHMNPISSDGAYTIYQHSPFSLDKPYQLTDKTVLIGGLGWYDYGFTDFYFEKDVEEKGLDVVSFLQEVKKNWHDGKKVNFKLDDISLTKRENKRYLSLIEQHHKKDVFLINHFIPFARYVTWNRSDEAWCQSNAFMGSSQLETIIEKYKQIKYVAFGHTHRRYGQKQIGERLEICSPLGYVGEWESLAFKGMSTDEKVCIFKEECELSKQIIKVQ